MAVVTRSPTSNTGTAWTDPANAYADGGGAATITSAKPSGNNVWGTYGFSLAGYTITQVKVRYDALTGGNEQIRIDVSWDGGTTWSAQQVTALSGTETTYWYDVTAETAWTPAKLANGQLQVRADAYTVGGAGSVSLDWLPVEVTYEAAGAQTFYQSVTATAIGVGGLTKASSFYRTLPSSAVGVAVLNKGMYLAIDATALGVALLSTAKMFSKALDAVALGVATLTKVTTYSQIISAVAVGVVVLTKTATHYLSLVSTAIGIPQLLKGMYKTLSVTAIGTPVLDTTLTASRTLGATAIGQAVLTKVSTFFISLTATAIGTAQLITEFIAGAVQAGLSFLSKFLLR